MEVHADMTALEARFEEELTSLPDWHTPLEGIEPCRGIQQPKESRKDKRIEELMILGI